MKKNYLLYFLLFIFVSSCKNDEANSGKGIMDRFEKKITKNEFVGDYDLELDKSILDKIEAQTKENKVAKMLLSFGMSQVDINLKADEDKLYINGSIDFLDEGVLDNFDLGNAKNGIDYRIDDDRLYVVGDSSSLNGAYLSREPYGYKMLIDSDESSNVKIDSLILLLKRKEVE